MTVEHADPIKKPCNHTSYFLSNHSNTSLQKINGHGNYKGGGGGGGGRSLDLTIIGGTS